MVTVTYLYDDHEHQDRPSGHIESPAWTDDDRSLLLGLTTYEASLCPGCGIPKSLAWHFKMEGFYEGHQVVCHACTGRAGGRPEDEVAYSLVEIDEAMTPERIAAFPPFDLHSTVTEPTGKSDRDPDWDF